MSPRGITLLLLLLALLSGCRTLPTIESHPLEPDEPLQISPLPAPDPVVAVAIAPGPIDDGAELFSRMTARFAAPACVRGERNRYWRQRYTVNPRGFESKLRRALPLLAHVVEAIEHQDLPGQFALIPIVESGLRIDVRGPGGPQGLWQMITSTARNHGVRVDSGYDGRNSPVDATEAALSYLSTLQAEFGDWRASAMAYNAGEGRLRRAFARAGSREVSGERRLPPGLSPITYNYVAKLQALACLIASPERHGLELPREAFTPFMVRKAEPGHRSLADVAKHFGLPLQELKRWNAAHRGPWAAGIPRRLLLPAIHPVPLSD